MMLLLANAGSAAPEGLKDWLEALVWLAGAALLGIKIFGHFQKSKDAVPQPLVTTRAQRIATFDELSQLRREFEDFRTEQRKSNHEILTEGHERMEILRKDIRDSSTENHKRTNDVLAAVSRLEGIIAQLNQQS